MALKVFKDFLTILKGSKRIQSLFYFSGPARAAVVCLMSAMATNRSILVPKAVVPVAMLFKTSLSRLKVLQCDYYFKKWLYNKINFNTCQSPIEN